MNDENDVFELERLRDELAKSRKLKKLKKTYKESFAEIKNINSPEFWDKLLSNNRKREEKSPISRDRINTVIKLIRARKGRLLDVGFGYGLIEENISKNTFDLYGIDISQKAVKRIKRMTKGNFKKGSILDISFQDEFFDVVLALEVLEHISPHNTFRAFSELKRVLRSGGILVVSVPLNEKLEEMCKKGVNPSGHVRIYTPELIEAELQIIGFQVHQKKFLYAFKNFYWLKKALQTVILKNRWVPNNIIILARRP